MDEEAMFEILSMSPSNNLRTVYTAIMSPSTSYWFTKIIT